MIAAPQVHRRLVLRQVRVDRVAAGEHPAVQHEHVTDFQRPHRGFVERRRQRDLAAGPRYPGLGGHVHHGARGIAVQPLPDGAARRVDDNAQAPERPAVVGHRHEEARREPVDRPDLAPDERHVAAKAHRPDAELVHRAHDRGFELGKLRIRVHIVERAEQLLLGERVAAGPVAADAHADGARRAALALRRPDGVQDALAHALERAVGAPEVRQLHRHGVLRVAVLTAAALEEQPHLDLVPRPTARSEAPACRVPMLLPVFLPVMESTEFGRSLPRLVASAIASRMRSAIHIWSAPRGTWISKVGIPVSWQMAPSPSAAWSMLSAIMDMACPACVSVGSASSATFMAARTSGGRSVDVLTMSSSMLAENSGNMRRSITPFRFGF